MNDKLLTKYEVMDYLNISRRHFEKLVTCFCALDNGDGHKIFNKIGVNLIHLFGFVQSFLFGRMSKVMNMYF